MTADDIQRILAALILIVGVGISTYFRLRADRISGERISMRDDARSINLVLRLGGLLLWLTPIIYIAAPGWLAWSSLGLPDWAGWIGAALGLLCDGLIYWIFSSIGTGITPSVSTRRQHTLVTDGPYRWVRHPLYTVGTTFFLAFALMADSWLIAILAALAFVLLAVRTRSEEAHLIGRFGDAYRSYMRRTGRFFPRVF